MRYQIALAVPNHGFFVVVGGGPSSGRRSLPKSLPSVRGRDGKSVKQGFILKSGIRVVVSSLINEHKTSDQILIVRLCMVVLGTRVASVSRACLK